MLYKSSKEIAISYSIGMIISYSIGMIISYSIGMIISYSIGMIIKNIADLGNTCILSTKIFGFTVSMVSSETKLQSPHHRAHSASSWHCWAPASSSQLCPAAAWKWEKWMSYQICQHVICHMTYSRYSLVGPAEVWGVLHSWYLHV